jgi:2-polyprenyl-6-methoxyphenol hydroxylase-like FAD-dependent oxidoreductase
VLEHALRERVRRIPNVRIQSGVRVSGLIEHAGRVTGVRFHHAYTPEERLAADLVVDASGRNSKSVEWLETLGLPTPRVDEVALETRYASRIYARRPSDLGGAVALMIVSDPRCPRGGIALALDEQRWLVSQYAMGPIERPPTDHDGYVAFARRLPSPELAQILAHAEPLTDFATLRFPSAIRRRYETLEDPAPGFIALGDASCSFNPTFGQGITVAAKQALVLRELAALGERADLEPTFFARASRVVDVAWNMAAGRSFLYDGVVGRPTLKMRLANAYMPRVVARAHDDVQVATALLETLHFLSPPESLFAPRILRRVLAGAPPPSAERPSEIWQDAERGIAPDSFRYHAAGQGGLPGAR